MMTDGCLAMWRCGGAATRTLASSYPPRCRKSERVSATPLWAQCMSGLLSILRCSEEAIVNGCPGFGGVQWFHASKHAILLASFSVLIDSLAIVDLALDSPFVEGHDFDALLDSLAIVDLVLDCPYVEGGDFDDPVQDER